MQLSSTVNHGMFQNLDRLCSSTVNTYPFKAKIADLNDALDWYASLAFKADGNWNFDDLNNTSPPIDTQSIVSGTNRYKVGSFTAKILNLLKLEVADSAGNFLSLTPETLEELNGSFDDVYINATSGVPTHYIKYGDFIYLRPSPNYNYASGLKAYFNRAASKFQFVPVTVTAATDLFAATSHGLSAGDTVVFETDGTIPTGLTADQTYYVISGGLTADAFKVSTTLGGAAVDVTDAQSSSNHAFLKTSGEPGIISTHHLALVRKAAMTFLSYTSSTKLGMLPALIVKDETDIMDYFGLRDKDKRKRLTPIRQNNR